MATAVTVIPERSGLSALTRSPNAWFWAAAIIILGGCATEAALGHWANQPNRDLFQHMAALRALIADMHNPGNPFVATAEGTRHFHPYWVAMAAAARAFGWSLNQTIAAASYVSMAVLASGFWLFGKAYFRSDWGPAALLVAVTLGWTWPISHTGFVNVPTLVEGAAYPAQLLTGLSLILWALVIKSMDRPRLALLIVPLVAFMFATHQLGAGLGLIVATSIGLLWPQGSVRNRLWIFLAIAVGLGVSMAWPYHNPFDLLRRAGNPTWRNGVEWYSVKYCLAILIPSAAGLVGLLRPNVRGTGLPLLVALLVLVIGFVAGAFGFLTGTRFAPIAALLLQVGLAAILVRVLDNPQRYSDRLKLAVASVAFGIFLIEAILLAFFYYPMEYKDEAQFGSVYDAAAALTADIPDHQEVAAYDVAAWPISATGQKVLSVPWPEPMISDLSRRQQLVEHIFTAPISREERIRLAMENGVRTLILDARFGPLVGWRRREVLALKRDAFTIRRSGPLMRIDLY